MRLLLGLMGLVAAAVCPAQALFSPEGAPLSFAQLSAQLPEGGWILIEDDGAALADYVQLLEAVEPRPKVVAWQRFDFSRQGDINPRQGQPERLIAEAPAWLDAEAAKLIRASMQRADYLQSAQLSAAHREGFLGTEFKAADENFDGDKLRRYLASCPNPEGLEMAKRVQLHHGRNQFLYMTLRNNTLPGEINLLFVEPLLMAKGIGVDQWLRSRGIAFIKLALAGADIDDPASYVWRRRSGPAQNKCWVGAGAPTAKVRDLD